MEFTRINNDVNGNPRYVTHFLELLNNDEQYNDEAKAKGMNRISYLYSVALAKAKKIGGKKYHNKQFGGGVVFQSYNTTELKKDIELLKNNRYE